MRLGVTAVPQRAVSLLTLRAPCSPQLSASPSPHLWPPLATRTSFSGKAEAEGETLRLAEVVVPPEVEAMVARVWAAQRGASVFGSPAEAVELIRQVGGWG